MSSLFISLLSDYHNIKWILKSLSFVMRWFFHRPDGEGSTSIIPGPYKYARRYPEIPVLMS